MVSETITITIPSELWAKYLEFRRVHVGFKFSKWVQLQLEKMIERNDYLECKFFKDGLCHTEVSVNECSKMIYGKCILEAD